MKISLEEISQNLKIDYLGKNHQIDGLNLCNRVSSKSNIISYINNKKYVKYLIQNKAIKALFIDELIYEDIKPELDPEIGLFVVQNPEKLFYDLHDYLLSKTEFYNIFNFNKTIGIGCQIHNSAIIEEGVIIGNNVVVGTRAIIKKGSKIGNNVNIGSGTIIGSEGFQLIKNELNEPFLIRHAGGVYISDNVHIGDNTCICNSLFEGYTFIGKKTMIDNLVHIAHNCIIGENCIITAGVILSGSSEIKNNVWLAPNSTLSNRVILENNSFVGIGSVVLKKVPSNTKVFGNPAKEI